MPHDKRGSRPWAAGAVRVRSFVELFSAAKCLASRYRPVGRRLAATAAEAATFESLLRFCYDFFSLSGVLPGRDGRARSRRRPGVSRG